MTLKELAQALVNKKYSHIPEHARPVVKYRDGTANELTKAILAYFELRGWKAFRQASEGRYLPEQKVKNVLGQQVTVKKGMYIPRSRGAKGSGDISGALPPHGTRIEIEIKIGKDRQSDVQKEFQAEIEAMGAIYMIVRTWQDFIFQISKYAPKNASV